MRGSPGRRGSRVRVKKKGNLNQKSKHQMRTMDGMIHHAKGEFKRELLARRGGYNPPKEKPK